MSAREIELYYPVKDYLHELGFKVDAEVNGCDIVATHDSDIIIIELKNSFSLKLLYQAVERQTMSNLVYVAIANRTTKKYPPNIKNIKKVLFRLNIGLLIVNFRKYSINVEPVIEPKFIKTRLNRKKRINLIRELDGRYQNFNIGGSPSSKKQITAYLLNSIQIAVILDEMGKASPSLLIKNGTASNTQSILSKNFNNWFIRIERGVYALSPMGIESLQNFPEQRDYFKKKYVRKL